MKTLLKIQSSLFGANGHSSRLVDEFAAQWLANNPGGRVVTRDLAQQPVPHLSAERIQAFATPPADRSEAQQAVTDYSDALIAELQAADEIVLGVPMYNFSVPSTLRAYFDHIGRAGITFRYTASGPEGLVKGKRAYVFITRGGFYSAADDTQTPYVRNFLAFIGITDVAFVHAEGLNISEASKEKSLTAARASLAALTPATARAA